MNSCDSGETFTSKHQISFRLRRGGRLHYVVFCRVFLTLSLSTKLGFISRVRCARTYSRSECECACFVVALLERSNGAKLSTWTSCVLSRNRSTNCDVTTKISVDCLTPDPTLCRGRLSLDLRLFFPIFDLLSVLCLFFFSLRIFSTSVRTFLIL